jgi:hypothetical protein
MRCGPPPKSSGQLSFLGVEAEKTAAFGETSMIGARTERRGRFVGKPGVTGFISGLAAVRTRRFRGMLFDGIGLNSSSRPTA